MARVTQLTMHSGVRQIVHQPAECTWQSFDSNLGPILQIDSFGSSERKIPGKKSQTLQFDRHTAGELLGAIRATFPGL